MKRIIGFLLLLSLLVLTACSSRVTDPKTDAWDSYQKRGALTIGFDNTFVPMGFQEKNGTNVGFDIDLANRIFEKQGLKVNWQPIDWDMKETELNNGTIDLIWNGYTQTEERAEKVNFSLPYMANEQVLVAKKSSSIQTPAAMENKILGAQAGSSGYLKFEEYPDLLKQYVKNNRATQYQSFNEALIDLENDRIDGLLIDRVYANYYLTQKGVLEDYNVFAVGFPEEAFAVGIRKSDKTLQERLNQGLLELYQTGQFQEISDKWFGDDVASKQLKEEAKK